MAKSIMIGGAPAVAQVDTCTPASLAQDDILWVRLEDYEGHADTIQTTADADPTVQEIVEALHTLAVARKTDGVAPWNDVTVTEDDTKLIVTADTAGMPFLCTCGVIGAGGSTFTRAADTACGGPGLLGDAENYLSQTVFADGEELIISRRCDASAIYGGDFTANKIDVLDVERGFDGEVGSWAHPLHLSCAAKDHRLVTLAGGGATHLQIDSAALITAREAAAHDGVDVGCNLTGSVNTKVVIRPGSGDAAVGLASLPGESFEVDEIDIAAGVNEIGEGVVKSGSGANPPDLLTVSGGETICRATATKIVNTATGGELDYRGGNVVNVESWAGYTRWDTAANITTMFKNGGQGVMDFSMNREPKTIEAAELSAGFDTRDPFRSVTWTNDYDFVGCGKDDGNLDLGVNYTGSHSEI